MRRDARAPLLDVIESCDAVTAAVSDLDLDGYLASRLVRSSVEREFIIIGEAMVVLSRIAPDVFAAITQARRIVDFRNQLTHAYSMIEDDLVWEIAAHDVAILRAECDALKRELDRAGASD